MSNELNNPHSSSIGPEDGTKRDFSDDPAVQTLLSSYATFAAKKLEGHFIEDLGTEEIQMLTAIIQLKLTKAELYSNLSGLTYFKYMSAYTLHYNIMSWAPGPSYISANVALIRLVCSGEECEAERRHLQQDHIPQSMKDLVARLTVVN